MIHVFMQGKLGLSFLCVTPEGSKYAGMFGGVMFDELLN